MDKERVRMNDSHRARVVGALLTLGLACLVAPGVAAKKKAPIRRVAVTFDDLPMAGSHLSVEQMREVTLRLVGVLREEKVSAVGFVNESKLHVEGEREARTRLLELWLDAGAELGNHTWSHASFQDTPLDEFEQEVIRGEETIRALAAERGGAVGWFRHPYLRTGPDPETKAAFESFLSARGYTVAPVTVHNTDWMFNSVYSKARADGDEELMAWVARSYLNYTATQFEFYEQVARQVVGRPISHVFLVHANELNADHFAEVVELIRRRGYRFVGLKEALRDDAYSMPDHYTGPAGVSWLWRWDRSGPRAVDWKTEIGPPEFIRRRYEELDREPSGYEDGSD